MSEYIDPNSEGLPPTIPPPEWIENITCYSPELLHNLRALEQDSVSLQDVVKSFIILLTTSLTLCLNLIFIVVLNCKYYKRYLKPQPRHVLTAMAVNDLFTGCLVLSFGVYTALLECWPLGQFWCQIQACIVLLFACLVASAFFYGVIVLHPSGFHFNVNGLMICEPYYLSNDALIFASCIFYFPTTMVLMYCYGTIFHSTKAKTKYRNVIFNTLPLLAGQTAASGIDRFMQERKRNDLASRSSAAISLTFIIAVTPWAIKQVITSVTRTTAPAIIDFIVSWLEASHSVWSPTIYWMLNPKFRRAAERFLIRKILCRPLPLIWNFYQNDNDIDSLSSGDGKKDNRSDDDSPNETIREKLWGEILEKSLSTRSLNDFPLTENLKQLDKDWNNHSDGTSSTRPGCSKHNKTESVPRNLNALRKENGFMMSARSVPSMLRCHEEEIHDDDILGPPLAFSLQLSAEPDNMSSAI